MFCFFFYGSFNKRIIKKKQNKKRQGYTFNFWMKKNQEFFNKLISLLKFNSLKLNSQDIGIVLPVGGGVVRIKGLGNIQTTEELHDRIWKDFRDSWRREYKKQMEDYLENISDDSDSEPEKSDS